jgi:hypothetical protein
MRGIVASVVFLLALSSLARAGDSGTTSPSKEPNAKAKDAGHAHATQTVKAPGGATGSKVGNGEHHAAMKGSSRGSMDDSEDDGDDDDGDGGE